MSNRKSRRLPDTIRISEAARILGINPMTLRRWDESGLLKPAVRTPSRKDRKYTRAQILKVLEQGLK